MTDQTIRGRMQSLQIALSGAEKRTNHDHLMGMARRRANELEKAVASIDVSYRAIHAISLAGVRVIRPEPGSLPAIAKSTLDEAIQRPLSAGDDAAEALVASAQKYASACVRAAQQAWSEFKAENAPSPSDTELLRLAEPDNPGLSQQHSLALADLDVLGAVGVPLVEHVKKWQEAVGQLNIIAEKVSVFAQSPAVIDFLRRANVRSGAPLSSLDHPDVRQFLAHGQRDARFVVIVKRSLS
ncbi:hypothetical protein [Lolliginicoccus suaedae]|uniref:hypothetical protein n=1 Tax=Lolliginicoccus suaedae TaxID=2605429 RepID=UPI0011EF5635|nr:hypothetical protein [Lolliginicoccus suaedae]